MGDAKGRACTWGSSIPWVEVSYSQKISDRQGRFVIQQNGLIVCNYGYGDKIPLWLQTKIIIKYLE